MSQAEPASPRPPAPRRRRLEVRVSEDQAALIRQAADLQGETVSSFVLSIVTGRAEEVLAERRDLVLSRQAYDHFIEELDKPPQRVPELADLFTKHPPLPER